GASIGARRPRDPRASAPHSSGPARVPLGRRRPVHPLRTVEERGLQDGSGLETVRARLLRASRGIHEAGQRRAPRRNDPHHVDTRPAAVAHGRRGADAGSDAQPLPPGPERHPLARTRRRASLHRSDHLVLEEPAWAGVVAARRYFVGTAGWNIPRVHAPRFAAEGSQLQRYASLLSAAEINSSFYRPHKPETYERWAAAVPRGFRFAVKV